MKKPNGEERHGLDRLLHGKDGPESGYRTYAGMVAEHIPLVYDGKWAAAACTA